MKKTGRGSKNSYGGVEIRFEESREVGLENLGNSCYINSVVNCLVSLDRLQIRLKEQGMQRTKKFVFCVQKIYNFLEDLKPQRANKYIRFIRQVGNTILNMLNPLKVRSFSVVDFDISTVDF